MGIMGRTPQQSVGPASEALAGYVQLASVAEALAGLNQTKAVTPEGLQGAIDVVGNQTVKAQYFATISAGTTTGTISKPAGDGADVAFVMDEWDTDTDALLSTLENGKPTFSTPTTALGVAITTTFNTAGEFAFSGTPSPANDIALIYVYKCYLTNLDPDEVLFESELISHSHSLLSNLDADDHEQYHNDTRGDVRYYKKTELNDDALDGTAGADLIGAAGLDSPTYNTLQDFMDQFGQRTKITGIDMSDNFDGTVEISAGTAWCKTTSSVNADGVFFDFAGGATDDISGALTDLVTNYVYLDYNEGTPQIVHDTTGALLGQYDHIVLGQVFRSGINVHILNADETGLDIAHKTKLRLFQEGGATRVSGMVTSTIGTRGLAVTAGAFWMGLTRIVSLVFDSDHADSGTATSTESGYLNDTNASFTANDFEKRVHNTTDNTYTDVLEVMSTTRLRLKDDIMANGEGYDLHDAWDDWYTSDGGSTWTQVEGEFQVPNFYYNNTASGLVELVANRYNAHWLYLDLEGAHLHMVHGQGNYTAAEAEIAQIPSLLPPIASGFGILIAKIVVQKSSDTLLITYPWTSAFESSLATDHGSLAGLADDDHTQYVLATGARAMGELTLTPKASSISTVEGTIFYCSDDNHVYVGTE